MKKYLIILLLITPFHASQALSFGEVIDSVKQLMPWHESTPELTFKLTDTKGNIFTEKNTRGKYLVINFWATWCSPCKKELNTIHDIYPDWQDETGVTLVAVSIDDEKTKARVSPYINAKAWDFEILLDPNGDFKRAMGVNNVPHTFLVDSDGNIVYSHNNYAPGDEDELYEQVLKLGSK